MASPQWNVLLHCYVLNSACAVAVVDSKVTEVPFLHLGLCDICLFAAKGVVVH